VALSDLQSCELRLGHIIIDVDAPFLYQFALAILNPFLCCPLDEIHVKISFINIFFF